MQKGHIAPCERKELEKILLHFIKEGNSLRFNIPLCELVIFLRILWILHTHNGNIIVSQDFFLLLFFVKKRSQLCRKVHVSATSKKEKRNHQKCKNIYRVYNNHRSDGMVVDYLNGFVIITLISTKLLSRWCHFMPYTFDTDVTS